jgi:hypothetical protein
MGYHTSVRVRVMGERESNRGIMNTQRRKEAILIKVDEGRDWIEVYKKIMAARNTIEGATGMRKPERDTFL